jgi:hypothetical protein
MNISWSDNTIDSRDIIKELDDLESELEVWIEDGGEEEEFLEHNPELEELRSVNEQGESYGSDWEYGCTLINAHYWIEYCEDLVKELGELPDDLPWYLESNIDWKGVAQDLESDYTTLEVAGRTFYFR